LKELKGSAQAWPMTLLRHGRLLGWICRSELETGDISFQCEVTTVWPRCATHSMQVLDRHVMGGTSQVTKPHTRVVAAERTRSTSLVSQMRSTQVGMMYVDVCTLGTTSGTRIWKKVDRGVRLPAPGVRRYGIGIFILSTVCGVKRMLKCMQRVGLTSLAGVQSWKAGGQVELNNQSIDGLG
jgi:hypothetical protein